MKKQIIVAITIFAFVFFVIANARISKSIIESERALYETQIDILHKKSFNQFIEIESLKNTLKEYGLTVVVTMYEPIKAQTDNTPNITADGSIFNIHDASSYNWIALSRDLIKKYNKHAPFKYGDLVYISEAGHKSGLYYVKDTMNIRFKNAVDILETKGTTPYKFANAKLTKVVWNM